MKKTILTLACLFCLTGAAQSQIVITEIMYNPPEGGTDSLEYVEFFNSGNAEVNMENWTMFGVVFTFPAVVVQPGEYLLLAVNAAAIQNQFGVSALQWTGNALSNNGETIRLLDSSGATADEVTYSNIAPWPTEAAGGGASLELCDPSSDNSNPGNWIAATTPTGVTINGIEVLGTPGAAANCNTNPVLQAVNDQATAASGQTVTIAVLANDLQPNPLTGPVVIVNTPTQGSATINPDNTINYISNPGFCGTDQFTYQVCDNDGCDEATVNITVKCYAAYSIGTVTTEDADGVADSLGADCELQGTVYGVNFRPVNNNQPSLLFTLIDDVGNGISVSSLNGNFGYTVKEKDKITVRGTIGQFNGLTEIQPDFITKQSENNPLLLPFSVDQLSENTESRLIRVNNLHFVNPAEWTTGMGASGFNVRAVSDDHPLDTISIRIDRDIETYNAPVPSEPFNVTGLGGQFDASSPYTSGYQILPRYNADISTLTGVKAADFSAQVQISPNPVSDRLLVQTEVAFDRILLFTATGAWIKTLENPSLSEQISTRQLPEGMYFIRFEKDGAVWTSRFVKH